MKNLKILIAVASGQQQGDIVIRGAYILNVFTRKFEKKEMVLSQGYIAGVADEGTYTAKKILNYTNHYIVPSFIDAHVHIESSMLLPKAFGDIIAQKGTSTIIADSHEIANVLGADAVRFMVRQSEKSPCEMFFMIPSCVPATDFEHTGGSISAKDIQDLLSLPRVLGLGEMMNYPGVINGDNSVLEKIKKADGYICDGHAPLVTGKDLQAYRCVGIKTDHECRTFNEALEKINAGMWILLREGSSARDLEHIVPELVKAGMDTQRFAFCTDDKNVVDILKEGHIDHSVRTAIALGIKPENAFCMASFNPSECYGLVDRGAIAAGYKADFLVLDNIQTVSITDIFKNGELLTIQNDIQQNNPDTLSQITFTENTRLMEKACNSIHLGTLSRDMFTFGKNDEHIFQDRHLIHIESGSLNTNSLFLDAKSIKTGYEQGKFCKIAVLERHKATGLSGLALLDGYGLKQGAIASSIGHDSHNIICAGINPDDMLQAVLYLQKIQGGICIVLNGEIKAALSLQVAGLMSLHDGKHVANDLKKLEKEVTTLGIYDSIEPFVTLSFLALPVIPELRITDQGLFDVIQWRHICQ